MSWNYAELSKAAKAAGGPEKLVDMIEQGAKDVGRIEGQTSMLPWLGVVAFGASALTTAIIEIASHIKAKKAISQQAVDQAKTELIQGIKNYNDENMAAQLVEGASKDNFAVEQS